MLLILSAVPSQGICVLMGSSLPFPASLLPSLPFFSLPLQSSFSSFLWDKVFLCSPGCPKVNRGLPASGSLGLGLKAWAVASGFYLLLRNACQMVCPFLNWVLWLFLLSCGNTVYILFCKLTLPGASSVFSPTPLVISPFFLCLWCPETSGFHHSNNAGFREQGLCPPLCLSFLLVIVCSFYSKSMILLLKYCASVAALVNITALSTYLFDCLLLLVLGPPNYCVVV